MAISVLKNRIEKKKNLELFCQIFHDVWSQETFLVEIQIVCGGFQDCYK